MNKGSKFRDCQDWSVHICPVLDNEVMLPWAKNGVFKFSMFIVKDEKNGV